MHLAAWKNSKEVVALLIDEGANVHAKDNWGRTPLHLAAWKNSKEVVALLLKSGASTKVRDNRNWTPVGYARKRGIHNGSIFFLLLDARACREGRGSCELHIE